MGIIKNEDAQFMLLAGFMIAIGLVITTVMLNNIIFEGNMAGEAGAEPLKYDAVNLMQVSAGEMRSAYRNATNVSGIGNDKMIANFTNQTQNFSANLPVLYALHGEGVNVSWDVSNWNNSIYASFTDNGTAGGAANWTVMESVKNLSVFELRNVSVGGVRKLKINVTNQIDVYLWSAELNQTMIEYKNQSGTIVVVSFDSSSIINLLDLNYYFNKSAGSNYKISFENGDNANGRFKILGNTTYSRNFTRARDYILNATVTLSTSRMRANITIPVSVPW